MRSKVLGFLIVSVKFISTDVQNIGLVYNKESDKAAFAVQEMECVLQEKGMPSVMYALSQ